MAYETLCCSETTCPLHIEGYCTRFNVFDDLPCLEMGVDEFENFKMEIEGQNDKD